jgi:hypothetical protein
MFSSGVVVFSSYLSFLKLFMVGLFFSFRGVVKSNSVSLFSGWVTQFVHLAPIFLVFLLKYILIIIL